MKHFVSRAARVVVPVVLVVLICRLIWTAAGTETGFQTLGDQIRDATIGWVVGSRTSIPSREPIEQARYWLPEVNRIVDRNPADAQIAAGAALVLDHASDGYIARYLKTIDTKVLGAFSQLDRRSLQHVGDAFENKCVEYCLEQATNATRLDPANVEWWRLRAILLWRNQSNTDDQSPRDPNWVQVLKECSTHDSENALYDYLAAYFYWTSSSRIGCAGGSIERLIIEDESRFQLGTLCFERAQSKPLFVVGDDGYVALTEFLSKSRLLLTEQEQVLSSRSILRRRTMLFRDLWTFQSLRGNDSDPFSNFKNETFLERQGLYLIDQFASPSSSTRFDEVALACRVETTERLRRLATRQKDSFSVDELSEIIELEKNARLEEKVVGRAALELFKVSSRRAGFAFTGNPSELVWSAIYGVSFPLFVLSLSTGLISIALVRHFPNPDLPIQRPLGRSLLFLVAVAITSFFFGLAASGIIASGIQAWILTILIISVPVTLLSWFAWRWYSKRSFTFGLRSLFVLVFAFCVLFGVLTGTNLMAVIGFPFEISIPSRGWDGVDVFSLRGALRPFGNWLWAFFQWLAYYGHYSTIVLWLGFIAVELRFRERKFLVKNQRNGFSLREKIGAFSNSICRPALFFAFTMLLTFLVLAPTQVKSVEQEFQQGMAFPRNPAAYWDEVERTVEMVRSNERGMEELREIVELEVFFAVPN